jgi:hypothetical protein
MFGGIKSWRVKVGIWQWIRERLTGKASFNYYLKKLGLKRKSNLEMSKMRRRRREGEELEENEEELAK